MKLALIATILVLITIALAVLYTYRRSEKRYTDLKDLIDSVKDHISFLTLRADNADTVLTKLTEHLNIQPKLDIFGFERKVLCITKGALEKNTIAENGVLRQIDFSGISIKDYHLVDRSVVDDENDISIGQSMPQAIGYVAIRKDGKYLTYSRKKGEERRLHDTRSLGFGGHIDITDVIQTVQRNGQSFSDVLINGVLRELNEELGLPIKYLNSLRTRFTDDLGTFCIMDNRDEVGQVHLALVFILDLEKHTNITIGIQENVDPQWKTASELVMESDVYENWSQTVIEEIIT